MLHQQKQRQLLRKSGIRSLFSSFSTKTEEEDFTIWEERERINMTRWGVAGVKCTFIQGWSGEMYDENLVTQCSAASRERRPKGVISLVPHVADPRHIFV
jgi:hypothetical protein